ncbi:MAG: DNA polymerase III subunit beta [Herpetosiphonaceae bacterium]|nr:DNA polymerase III subunit beta [Herpetosiphonaceae bacterium]
MKLSCLQENLKRGVGIVSHGVAAKSTLPVLSNILLTTENGRLRLQATNLEIGVTCWIGAKIEEEGAATIPAKLLQDFIGNLPNDAITMTLDEGTQTMHLACARSEANIKGIEADEFPAIPKVQADAPTVRIDPAQLRTAINQVAYAAATDETMRPVITGVLVRLHDASATFAAIDGFRLAVKKIELAEPVEQPMEVIIPARTLIEVGRVIGDSETPVEITVTPQGGQVLFHSDNVDLVSRLIDGKFPDYERMVPKQFLTRAVMDRNGLLQSTRQASVFASSSANIAKITLEAGADLVPGKLLLSANAAEVGDNKSELEGQVVGDGGQIAMNVKYLQDALNALPTPQVALEIQTPASPGVFRPVGDDSLLILVMPMTVR